MLVYAGFSNVVVGLIVLIEVLAGNFFSTDGALHGKPHGKHGQSGSVGGNPYLEFPSRILCIALGAPRQQSLWNSLVFSYRVCLGVSCSSVKLVLFAAFL